MYRGGFMKGQLHGDGNITYPNGQVAKGKWIKGDNEYLEEINEK